MIKINLDAVLDMAKTSKQDLSVLAHKHNYHQLIVRLDDEKIVDAALIESTNNYYVDQCEEWHMIMQFGTGTCPCNCDACHAGDDPEDWAKDGDQWPDFDTLIELAEEDLNTWKENK